MPEPLYDRRVNNIVAYHNDGAHEYFGYANKGSLTKDAKWQIIKMEYDTGYTTAGDPWIMKWAEGNDLPVHVWDDVETINYYLLKKR